MDCDFIVNEESPNRFKLTCKVCGETKISPTRIYRCRCPKSTDDPYSSLLQVGPGTELKRLLRLFLLKPIGACKCNQRAQLMDIQGPDWCQEHLEEIVGWLREEATNRKLPFMDSAARILIKKAIKNARHKLNHLE